LGDIKNSFVGFVVYTAAFLTWLIIYLNKRNDMGVTGDKIALIIPNGK
jgi:Presenilin enhancer-2 subunit of gamma secretase